MGFKLHKTLYKTVPELLSLFFVNNQIFNSLTDDISKISKQTASNTQLNLIKTVEINEEANLMRFI